VGGRACGPPTLTLPDHARCWAEANAAPAPTPPHTPSPPCEFTHLLLEQLFVDGSERGLGNARVGGGSASGRRGGPCRDGGLGDGALRGGLCELPKVLRDLQSEQRTRRSPGCRRAAGEVRRAQTVKLRGTVVHRSDAQLSSPPPPLLANLLHTLHGARRRTLPSMCFMPRSLLACDLRTRSLLRRDACDVPELRPVAVVASLAALAGASGTSGAAGASAGARTSTGAGDVGANACAGAGAGAGLAAGTASAVAAGEAVGALVVAAVDADHSSSSSSINAAVWSTSQRDIAQHSVCCMNAQHSTQRCNCAWPLRGGPLPAAPATRRRRFPTVSSGVRPGHLPAHPAPHPPCTPPCPTARLALPLAFSPASLASA
jgi:hypothetical protein